MRGEQSPDVTQSVFGARGAAAPLIRAVLAYRWVVVLVALATIAGAVGYLAKREPRYTADAKILFTPLQSGDGAQGLPLVVASADPTRDAQTAVTLLGGPRVATLAAHRLGPGWTAQSVAQDVTILPVGQTNIIVVEGTAHTPAHAMQAANAYAGASLDFRRGVLIYDAGVLSRSVATVPRPSDATGQARRAEINLLRGGADPNFSLIQRATAPTSSSATSAAAILALAAIGGIALGIVAAILLEVLSNRIRDGEELRELYPVPVLAYVPRLSRRDRAAVNKLEVPRESLAPAQMLASQLQARAHGHQVVLATGASIGDGTTTTMLQLAQALVTSGRSVLLIDGDSRTGDMTRRLGLERQASGLAELLADEATLSECVVGARALAELQVLPAGRRQWPGPLVGVRLREIVDQARELADHVLVDTAPLGQASDLVPALAEVDEVLVIARPGHTRRADFTLLRDVLDASGTTAVNMVVVGERSWQRQLPIAAARALDETAHPRPKATAPGADSRSGEIRRSDS